MSKNVHKETILVGQGVDLIKFYKGHCDEFDVKGIFCPFGTALPNGLERLGEIGDVKSYLRKHQTVKMVFCATTGVRAEEMGEIQRSCKISNVLFYIVLPVVNELGLTLTPQTLDDTLLLTPKREPLSLWYNRVLKRAFDFVVTLIFMLVAFPFVYIYKAINIKRKAKGPSFEFHQSCGPDGRSFREVSFRSEEHSLARLFNVLVGQMSLVGPACIRATETAEAPRLRRNHVKGGMTGWSQQKNYVAEEALAADIWYVEHWSLWLDVKILFKHILS